MEVGAGVGPWFLAREVLRVALVLPVNAVLWLSAAQLVVPILSLPACGPALPVPAVVLGEAAVVGAVVSLAAGAGFVRAGVVVAPVLVPVRLRSDGAGDGL